jgi:hypothetical protein
LTDESAIVTALNDAQPDVIVHSAAIRRPDEIKNDESLAQHVNVTAVRVIAEYVRAHASVMLFISTDYVFDGVHPPFDERAPTCPLNEYGVQKVTGERLVQDTAGGMWWRATHTHIAQQIMASSCVCQSCTGPLSIWPKVPLTRCSSRYYDTGTVRSNSTTTIIAIHCMCKMRREPCVCC